MKRKRILISIFIVGIILFPVLYNVIVIRSRIYYKIDYNVNLSNQEKIIHKVENFNYSAYLNYFNIPDPYIGIKSYVDADLMHFLKSRIKNDIGFTMWPSYAHNLRYSFLAENQSKLFLTYNNNMIFSVKDQNNQSFSLRGNFVWHGSAWYLNFTHIPYVYGYDSTVMLSDFILVEINVDYLWQCGYLCYHSYSFEQFLVLNKNLDVVLIFINHYIFID